MRALSAIAALLLAGCPSPCGEVGRAIADQTLTCEGSSSMGVGRARALQFTYECPNDQGWWDPFTMPRACSEAILKLDCETVRANGDDLEAWLSAHPSCDKLVPTDPSAPPTATRTTVQPPVDTGTPETPLDTLPCSSAGGDATDLTVTNDSGIAVDLFWRDEACELHLYWTLAAGESYVQPTLVGHVWVARELTGARPVVDGYEVVAAPADSWSISR